MRESSEASQISTRGSGIKLRDRKTISAKKSRKNPEDEEEEDQEDLFEDESM